MRHRYIFCGVVHGTDKISDFRLISKVTKYSLGGCVRVNIPDDLKLNHFNSDSYSTTSDPRTLNELGWDCYIHYEGKWRKFNWLKKVQPHNWFLALENIFSLYHCHGTATGWTSDYETYKNFWRAGINETIPFVSEEDAVYPQFKEDRHELQLPVNLKEIAPREDCEDDWYKIYQQLKEENNGNMP